jgi:ferrochelatase
LVTEFYRHKGYLNALVETIDRTLERFEVPSRPELIFSAHSVPMAVIERGDPYQRQIEETMALVMERGGWPNGHRLCYQSKVGASRWLQPTLRGTLRQLTEERIEEVCVVPISFVSDHVETLGEIDHVAREMAAGLGIRRFEMTPGLNDSPAFIGALADLVLEAAGARQERALAAG